MTPEFSRTIYVVGTPAKIWKLLTEPKQTPKYYFGLEIRAKLRKGANIEYIDPESRKKHIVGKVLEVKPREIFAHTFSFPDAPADKPSRVIYEIKPLSKTVCEFRLVHDSFGGETVTYKSVVRGWDGILSGFKTLLETGKKLDLPF
jgi:uncharacterized protein YndB with AHSA1/START domain